MQILTGSGIACSRRGDKTFRPVCSRVTDHGRDVVGSVCVGGYVQFIVWHGYS